MGSKNLSIEDLRAAQLEPHVDPLNEFSDRCRDEMRRLLHRGLFE